MRFRSKFFRLDREHELADFEKLRLRARVITNRILTIERDFCGSDDLFEASDIAMVKNCIFPSIDEVEESLTEYMDDSKSRKKFLPLADHHRLYIVCFRAVEMGEHMMQHFFGSVNNNAPNN